MRACFKRDVSSHGSRAGWNLGRGTGDYFDMKSASPGVLLVRKTEESRVGEIPAAVRVDGTARVETMSREESPLSRESRSRFDRRARVPAALDTRLNLKGEPMARTPEDASSAFGRSYLDLALMDNNLISRAGK